MDFELSKYSKIFKALSNEQRLKLFLLLYEHAIENIDEMKKVPNSDQCCDYPGMEKAFTLACKSLSISPSTISHHFKELQNAGLIKYERKGQMFICHINMNTVKTIKDLLK